MGKRRADLGTQRWRKLRLNVLERDGYECQIGGRGCRGVANSVDHIVPHMFGGDDSYSNLRACCGPCNSAAGARARSTRGAGFLTPSATPPPPITISLAEPRENRTERRTHRSVP